MVMVGSNSRRSSGPWNGRIRAGVVVSSATTGTREAGQVRRLMVYWITIDRPNFVQRWLLLNALG